MAARNGPDEAQDLPSNATVAHAKSGGFPMVESSPAEFEGSPAQTGEGVLQDTGRHRTQTEPSAEHTGSYSTNQAEPTERIPSVQTRTTHSHEDDAQQFAAPKRARAAPVAGRSQRRTVPRKASILGGVKRRATGAKIDDGKHDPFQYTFDSLSSDDTDSSSSSEDEAPIKRRKSRGRQEQQMDEHADDDDKGAKQAKKRGHTSSGFAIGNDFFKTKGRVSKRDGRLDISINETANSGYIAKALGQSIRNHLDIPNRDKSTTQRAGSEEIGTDHDDAEAKSLADSLHNAITRPRLNIVIMVIGSRGDIQPFLKLGRILQHTHGHRVRIASHPTFRDFVEKDGGLEFFSVGGDPAELMAFMVKNPGLIPSMATVREGEIQRRRAAMAEMFEGFWRACVNTTNGEHDEANLKLMADKHPFIADALIANPPSMAHVHIAERLGIPLHMMFTFPYTPTTQFPHPLANIKPRKSNVDSHYVNFMSYPLVEMLSWQGLGDLVNRFRENTLGLEPVSSLWAPGALYRMKVPYTYLWSPSLVPKPKDWGPEIDLAGFVFLELASNFQPPKELTAFLDAGDPPVYIGFGSIVVDDPDAFTEMIFKAAEMAGVRALVNKGWGGLGRSNKDTPKHVFMLDNTPHDWLFPRTKAVVHHGGAGTTAIGLKCAKPTMIVPFFGDQPFWGAMVAEARAGAHKCIPYKKLTTERLAEGIKQCLTEEAQQNVQKIADAIAREGDGAENAVRSFHRSLPLAGRHSMRCSILEDRVAVWQLRKSSLRLSTLAAELLREKGRIQWSDLRLLRHYEWNDFDGPGEPFTGGVGALADSFYGIGEGFGMVPVRIAKHLRQREEHERKKRARRKRREERERRKLAQSTTKLEDPVGAEGGVERTNTLDAEGEFHSPTRENTNTTLASTVTGAPPHRFSREVVEDVGWGIKRTGAAIITMPNDFHVAIAQGFHNAPRLYGDATVRKPTKITGVKSGFVAARKEFAYGIYDGFTGLVTQPRGDWEDAETLPAKFAGLGTGFGKGIGGFAIKNANAFWAPPAYIVKGLIKYLEKRADGPGSKAFIRKAHILQGEKDLDALKDQESEDNGEQLRGIKELVDYGWKVYSDIWAEAHKQFGPVGGNVVGRYRMRKERKQWDAHGALENVSSADRALQARKQGYEIETVFAKRKKEMHEAEKPRAGVMDRPESFEDRHDVLPDGRKEVSSLSDPQRQGESQEARRNSATKLSQVPEESVSETTAVATPEDELKHGDQEPGQSAAINGDIKTQSAGNSGLGNRHIVAA